METEHWPVAALQELDFGVLVLAVDGTVEFANQTATKILDEGRCLRLEKGRLGTADAVQAATLHRAVKDAASSGVRRMMVVGPGSARLSMAVVPMARHGTPHVLVMLGRRTLGDPLAVAAYAHTVGLTSAEARVLRGLCEGRTPQELACDCRLGVSTIRTQIMNVRAKTGARSIRALVAEVAALPPFTSILP